MSNACFKNIFHKAKTCMNILKKYLRKFLLKRKLNVLRTKRTQQNFIIFAVPESTTLY